MNDQNASFNAAAADAQQARYARRITAALSESSRTLAPDISERLKFAREQALQRARAVRPAPVVVPELAFSGHVASRRGGGPGWGLRLGSILPLVALVAGLVVIQQSETSSQISAAADIDTAILADDVPPDAYNDPGFVEFLKGTPN